MHVIIAGCGRVGSRLAATLDGDDHDVVVIDKNPAAFRRLPGDFGGRALPGIVFDRPTLEEAGIKRAQAFVAVTSGDNSNIVSARTAKDHYAVDHVVARIYDPERAHIYERLGITTIATARWTTEAVLRELLPEGDRIEGSIGAGAGDVVLLTTTVPPGVRDAPAALSRPGAVVLVAVTRDGATAVPVANMLLHAGDQLHLAVQREALDEVPRLIDAMASEARS